MSASLALAGLSGCTKMPVDKHRALRPPAGRARSRAPAVLRHGHGRSAVTRLPLLARSNEGRPTKIGGKSRASGEPGRHRLYAQGALLRSLRSRPLADQHIPGDEIRPWPAFVGAMQGPMAAQKASGGAGFRLLTQTVSSPTLAAQIRTLQQKFPADEVASVGAGQSRRRARGAQMAFGQQVETRYQLENADVMVSLDADFLFSGLPGFTMYARDWAKRREPTDEQAGMNRMYAIESTPTTTGFKADHRLAGAGVGGRAVCARAGDAVGCERRRRSRRTSGRRARTKLARRAGERFAGASRNGGRSFRAKTSRRRCTRWRTR